MQARVFTIATSQSHAPTTATSQSHAPTTATSQSHAPTTATSQSLQAACQLIERVGGVVASCCCVCVMPELQGLQKLTLPCIVLVPFQSDAAAATS